MQSSAASPDSAASPWTELAERADSISRPRPAGGPERAEDPRAARFERALEQQRAGTAGQRQATRGEEWDRGRPGEQRSEDPSSPRTSGFVEAQVLTPAPSPEPSPATAFAPAPAFAPATGFSPAPSEWEPVPVETLQRRPSNPEISTDSAALTGYSSPLEGAGGSAAAETPGRLSATPGLAEEIVVSAPQHAETGPSAATSAAERLGPAAPAQNRPEAPATPPPAATQASPAASAPSESLQLDGLRLEIDPDQRHARLELEPAELGRVSVQLELRAKSVRALLRVESREALEALRNQLPELRQAFEARGLAVRELELSFDPRGAASGQRSPDEAPSSPRRQRLRISAAEPSEPRQPALLPTTPRPVRPGGIDTLA